MTPQQADSTFIMHADTLAPVNKVPESLKRRQKQPLPNYRALHADIFEDSTHITSILSGDTLYVDRDASRLGEQGDPMPDTIANDNVITSIVLVCFLVALFASAQSLQFITRQAKNFFTIPRREFSDMSETSNELHFQLFLNCQTCLVMGVLFFFSIRAVVPVAPFSSLGQYGGIAVFTLIFAAYFLVKQMLYWLTGWVFFNHQKIGQWTDANMFLISVEGVLLLPSVFLTAYFDFSLKSVLIYVLIVIVLVKILTLYRSSVIFFHLKASYLQNILYFCALEVVPALILCGLLLMISGC